MIPSLLMLLDFGAASIAAASFSTGPTEITESGRTARLVAGGRDATVTLGGRRTRIVPPE